MARNNILTLVQPRRRRRQPVSFGGKGYDPRPPSQPTSKPATGTGLTWGGPNTLGANFARNSGFWNTPKTAPAAPSAPSVPGSGGSPAGSSTPVPGSPLADDAQAAAARAQAIFDATQKRAALVASGAYGASDLEEAVRRLRGQRPDDERNAKTAANQAGLFNSGALVKQLGDIASDYVRREGDERTAFDRSETNRQAQLAAANQEQTLALSAIDAALAERQAQRDADRAASGSLTVPQSQLPKKIFQKDYGTYGIRAVIRDGRLVAVDGNGQVIPGAVFNVSGKRRFVTIPGGI